MRLSQQSGQPATIEGRLMASRERLDLRRGLEGAAWVGLAAVSVFAVLRLSGYLTPASPWLSFVSGGAAWAIAGIVLLVGLLGVVIRLRRTRPSLLAVARRADRHFGLDERLSTAVEFGMTEGRAATPSPVLAALFRDAAGRAEQVNPKVLVPFSTPRPAWYILIVVVSLLALDFARPASTPEAASTSAGTSVAGDPAATADLILETASLLRRQAGEQQNEYMRVVAVSLERLAQDVIEGRLSRAEVEAELARLVAHAQLSLQAGEVRQGDLSSLSTPGDGDLQAWQDPGSAAGDPGSETGESAQTAAAADPGATAAGEALAALEDLRSQLDGDAQGGQAAAGGAPPEGEESLAVDFDGMDGQMNADPGSRDGPPPNLSADAGTPGLPGGGETGSPTGAPETGQAGAPGTGEMANADTPGPEPLPEASTSREFELPTQEGSRRRLPIEIVPDTKFSTVLETSVPQGDWRQTAEERVSSDFLGISYRSIASRYFLSRTEEPEAEAP